jgi:hypothetical protein
LPSTEAAQQINATCCVGSQTKKNIFIEIMVKKNMGYIAIKDK